MTMSDTEVGSGTRVGSRPQVRNLDRLPVDNVKVAGQLLLRAVAVKSLRSVSGTMDNLTGRLNNVADGSVGVKMAATGAKELADGKSPVRAGLRAGLPDRVDANVTYRDEKIHYAIGARLAGDLGDLG